VRATRLLHKHDPSAIALYNCTLDLSQGVRRLGELERWIAENLTADLRVERLAERVGMSPRNFARRYTETRKRTPTRAVDALRVEAARRALEENDDRINEIAERCGFTPTDCAQECAKTCVPNTMSMPTIQSPLVVAFSAEGDGLIRRRLHCFVDRMATTACTRS